jgi:hypothetical protein
MRFKSSDVWVTFFIVMALTTNIAFIYAWDMLHLTLAMIFNILATAAKYMMKRDELGDVSLGVSLVADLHMIPAFFIGFAAAGTLFGPMFVPIEGILMQPSDAMITVVGLSIGAAVANSVSVIMLVADELWKHTRRTKEKGDVD